MQTTERRVAWRLRLAARLFNFPQTMLLEVEQARYRCQSHATRANSERRVAWRLRLAARLFSFPQTM
jgi:hypothetical protein